MFRAFREYLAAQKVTADAIRDLTLQLAALGRIYQEQGPAAERLEALELSRHQWEAMCEGLLQKAEGKLRAANNAEARERANKKSYEHLLDPLAEVGDEPEAPGDPVPGNDAPPSEDARLLALRMAMASANPKAVAQRAKWGVR